MISTPGSSCPLILLLLCINLRGSLKMPVLRLCYNKKIQISGKAYIINLSIFVYIVILNPGYMESIGDFFFF